MFHPTAKMLVQLSKSQDIEAGDGTTSVVVFCGALLDQVSRLLAKGLKAPMIAESFQKCADRAEAILTREGFAVPVSMGERDRLIRAATTSLSSKVVSAHSDTLAPLATDAVLKVISSEDASNVDLRDVHVVKATGGTIDETELVEGLVFTRGASHVAGGPTRVANAKIGICQFHLSAPKTDIDNTVVVSDHAAMDRIIREERDYILNMCKAIKKSGCNVLLVQKSILRDAVNDVSLHFLAKLKIMVVTNIERDDIEFVARTTGARPIAHIDYFTEDKLGAADLAAEVELSGGTRVVKITGCSAPHKTVTLLVRGSNRLVLDETERSLHDAMCVVRALAKKKFLIPGGGAPEIECALGLEEWSKTAGGADAYCARAFAEALEVIPYTLAENAGMHPIHIVTELRSRHLAGERTAGINVRTSAISDMLEEEVVQPLLVTTSSISLAVQQVTLILKIDDIVTVRG